MSDVPRPRDGVESAIRAYPTLVWCFAQGDHGRSRCRRIPREGLVLGQESAVFDVPFDDARLAPRHAEIRREGGEGVVRDLGSSTGTRLNG